MVNRDRLRQNKRQVLGQLCSGKNPWIEIGKGGWGLDSETIYTESWGINEKSFMNGMTHLLTKLMEKSNIEIRLLLIN